MDTQDKAKSNISPDDAGLYKDHGSSSEYEDKSKASQSFKGPKYGPDSAADAPSEPNTAAEAAVSANYLHSPKLSDPEPENTDEPQDAQSKPPEDTTGINSSGDDTTNTDKEPATQAAIGSQAAPSSPDMINADEPVSDQPELPKPESTDTNPMATGSVPDIDNQDLEIPAISRASIAQASADPAPKRSSHRAAKVVGIIIATILVITAASIISLSLTINRPSPGAGRTDDSQNTLDKSLSSFENKYKGNIITLKPPATLPDWQTELSGGDGIYQYKYNNNSCQITLQQNSGVDKSVSSGSTLDSSINTLLDTANNKLNSKDMQYKTIGATNISSNKGDIPFITKEGTYTSNTNINGTIRVSAQWLGDNEFIFISACTTADWQAGQDLFNDFLSKTSLEIS